jgi:hypothetical protein
MDEGLPPERINCAACGHFYITHNLEFPYGCKGLGFRSLKLPCVEVILSSGADCRFFLPKQK